MLIAQNEVPRTDVWLGMIRAENVRMDAYPEAFDEQLERVLAERGDTLGEVEDARRRAGRDILRNGSYKPTGRGKPASEYLLRAASEDEYNFPRINGPVDICNLLSLKHVVAISLWDLDRAGAARMVFRLGRPGEGYVFNHGGQRIDVEDLLVGCRVREGDPAGGVPIVNPVRDALETKTTPDTRRVAACVYAPAGVFPRDELEDLCAEFVGLLQSCGVEATAAFAIAPPQSQVEV